jgi:hypothetical protein
MKALRNSAVNTPECSGFRRDAIYRHSDALLPDIASEQAAEPGLALTCVQVFHRNGLCP